MDSLWQQLFGHRPDWHVAFPALVIAVVIATALSEFAVSLLRWTEGRAAGTPEAKRSHVALRWAVRGALILVLTFLFIPPVLEMFGQPLKTGLRLRTLVDWVSDNGLRILLIVALAFVVAHIARLFVSRLERYLAQAPGAGAVEQAKRARTLGELILNIVRAFVIGTAGLMVLSQLGVNTAPLLTSAGIVGLAIGFGAQTLVKDVISGFFLILENQVRVGDVAEINGTGGMVEAITLRTIVLRDMAGAVHVFPCGAVTTLSNLTKDYAYALLDVQVHYGHDTDEVVSVLKAVGDEMQKDEHWAAAILAPLEVLGIESLGDAGVTFRIRMKTVPVEQWAVAREFRRRMKKAFEAKKIEIPIAMPISGLKA